MKRLHIHIRTDNLDQSIKYYAALFGAEPSRREPDYARWLLDDPAAHISLSTGKTPGIEHVGVAIDSDEALEAASARLRRIEAPLRPEKQTTCCYAQSNKYWSHDPQGTIWELFHSYGDSEVYGEKPAFNEPAPGICCAPGASM